MAAEQKTAGSKVSSKAPVKIEPDDPRGPLGNKTEKVGEVVSTRMAKTIVVEVTRRVPHPVYKRIVNKRKKFYAHDEESQANVGDVVRIVECRPLSRLKRWQLGVILRKAVQVGVEHPALAASADTRVKKTIKKKKKK